VLRDRPATPQVSGVVILSAASTPGRIWQVAARKSLPNQPTTSETLSALGSAACS
jgi:hypothetical protein